VYRYKGNPPGNPKRKESSKKRLKMDFHPASVGWNSSQKKYLPCWLGSHTVYCGLFCESTSPHSLPFCNPVQHGVKRPACQEINCQKHSNTSSSDHHLVIRNNVNVRKNTHAINFQREKLIITMSAYHANKLDKARL
jgi:hypothetical protein